MYKIVDQLFAIRQYFPPETFSMVEYCFREYRFDLRIVKPRKNKLGSFRFSSGRGNPLITVNADLGKYMFFLVFVHEIAHLIVHNKYPRNVPSHGKEWKLIYKGLIYPLLDNNILPAELVRHLRKYFINTPATFIRHTGLLREINNLDGKEEIQTLNDIPLNTLFTLSNGKRFLKLETRRTRCRCLCVDNKRYYDVACNAQIISVVSNQS